MGRIFATRLYIVPGAPRPFYHLRDAHGWCDDNGVPRGSVDTFDSMGEYKRWLLLQRMEKEGKITDLKRQVVFELIPPIYEEVVMRYKHIVQYYAFKEDSVKVFTSLAAAKRYIGKEEGHIEKVEHDEPVTRMKKVENGAIYTADFTYTEDGKEVVEDVKSTYTAKEKDYILRRKMLRYLKGITLKETII